MYILSQLLYLKSIHDIFHFNCTLSHGNTINYIAPSIIIQHEYFTEGHHLAHDKRFQQIQSTIKQLQKRAVGSHPRNACIVCGDFNNELRGSLAQVLLDGSIEANYQQVRGVVSSYLLFDYHSICTYALRDSIVIFNAVRTVC